MHNIEISRLVFLTVLTVLLVSRVFIESQNQPFTFNGDTDKAIMDEKYILKTLAMAGGTISYCLGQCLQNCRCLSFQICHRTECQLCSTNKHMNSSALQSKQGCTNYVFETKRSEENNQQCDSRSCTTLINCCMISNPCVNGGTCLPRNNRKKSLPRNNREKNNRRFDCKCPDGYTGNYCGKRIRSCRGYSGGNRIAGKYKALDDNMAAYEVFCDFDNNSSMTWTLIQSYKLSDRKYVLPLNNDDPLNQDEHSWNDVYRLSKTRMESIQEDSTKWRATCQYQKQGCTDIVRGSNDKMDILNGDLEGWFEVEYINVRGQSRSNCTVYFRQRGTNIRLHYHWMKNTGDQCEFRLNSGQTCADYFGHYYYSCIDNAHCCTESDISTTQIWFGGY